MAFDHRGCARAAARAASGGGIREAHANGPIPITNANAMRKNIHPCLEPRLTIHTNGSTYLYGIPSLALWAALGPLRGPMSGAAWRVPPVGGASATAFDQMMAPTPENGVDSRRTLVGDVSPLRYPGPPQRGASKSKMAPEGATLPERERGGRSGAPQAPRWLSLCISS